MRIKYLLATSVAALGATTLGFQSPALAQAAPAANSGQGGTTTLETVIVTANRRAENLQHVAVSVTALTGEALKERQVKSAFDLQYNTPNMTVMNTELGGRLAQGYNIRGQIQAADDAPPGVVEYLAEVPVQSQEVARSNYDMSSIQILEGPQGTLFGRNTNGGAVLYTPNKPTNYFDGYLTGQYGNYNDRYFEGMMNVAPTDYLSVRAAGNFERRDGFTKNSGGPDVDNLKYGTWRLGVDYTPRRWIENYTLVNAEYADEYGPGWILDGVTPCTGPSQNASCFYNSATLLNPLAFSPNPNPYLAMGLIDISQAYQKQLAMGIRAVDDANPSFEKEHGIGVTNTTTVDVGDIKFRNIFGYHTLSTNNFNNDTSTPDPALYVSTSIRYKTLTEEFQAQGHTDNNLFNWIAGVYYYHQSQDPFGNPNFDPSIDDNGATNNGLVAFPFLLNEPQWIHMRLKSIALYGQGTADLSRWVHGLSFTAGYRYTWDSPSLDETIVQTFSPLNVIGAPAGTICALGPSSNPNVTVDLSNCTLSAHAKYSAPNWTLNLSEKINDQLMVYIASRHGYKSGGFNSTTTNANFFTYGPEKLTDIEGGVKSDFHVGQMAFRVNGDVFYDWYTNLQLTNVVFIGGTPASIIENTGPDHLPSRAHIYGADLAVTAVPVKSLELTVSYGYLKGIFDHFLYLTDEGIIQNEAGHTYTGVPRHTLSLTGAWRLPIDPSLGRLTLITTGAYRSPYEMVLQGGLGSAVSAYWLVNSRLDWNHIAGKPLDVSLWVRNLTNQVYPLGYNPAQSFGFSSRYYGDPRMFGLTVTAHFGSRLSS
ncbi:MAG: TonB-dependent receptor [Caulobacteraceae bacterium]|nr:TonB-dependent receptor [Caulobacteraceae bacterium]